MEQRTREPRVNALRREIVIEAQATSRASSERVYGLLADVRSHLRWAGERQRPRARLLSVEASGDPAVVGTEFATTGADPMGRFRDRSIVTEATRPSTFEFVTEARLRTNRGVTVDWTNVHRYEISATRRGCRIAYSVRIVRIDRLPGVMALFNVGALGGLVRAASRRTARRGVENLAREAEERASASAGSEGG